MIFLIGRSGLVGSAFARICERNGCEFAGITRSNYAEYVGRSCNLLINANGNSRKPLARTHPMDDFDASVRSVRATLEDFRYDRYVHLSSCDVYADCSSSATTREDTPVDPALLSPYGMHKYLAELCVRHRAPDWLIARLGGFVGPGLKKNAVFDILQGGPLWLDPASELQFLHTDDAADIILRLADRGLTGQTVNVCGRGTVALGEVAERLGRQVAVQPGSPRVRYDVSVEKLGRFVDVPETRATVFRFVDRAVAALH